MGFLKKAPGTQTGYVKSWENTLKCIDRELRSLSRLKSFQLLITIAMAIHLLDSSHGAAKDSPFAMAKLSADMSASQTAILMRLSTQTVRLRRDNIFASVQDHHKAKLVDKLKALDIQEGSDGGFAATVKKVAKVVTSEHTLGSQLWAAGVNPGANAGSSKGNQSRPRSKSCFHPYVNTESRSQRHERNSQSPISFRSQGSSDSRSSTCGGRKQGRGGRGRSQSSNKRF